MRDKRDVSSATGADYGRALQHDECWPYDVHSSQVSTKKSTRHGQTDLNTDRQTDR